MNKMLFDHEKIKKDQTKIYLWEIFWDLRVDIQDSIIDDVFGSLFSYHAYLYS
jgi:hypothetical protein